MILRSSDLSDDEDSPRHAIVYGSLASSSSHGLRWLGAEAATTLRGSEDFDTVMGAIRNLLDEGGESCFTGICCCCCWTQAVRRSSK